TRRQAQVQVAGALVADDVTERRVDAQGQVAQVIRSAAADTRAVAADINLRLERGRGLAAGGDDQRRLVGVVGYQLEVELEGARRKRCHVDGEGRHLARADAGARRGRHQHDGVDDVADGNRVRDAQR